ncbi:MAG TPA: T9SS type A sorting domain-containing protein [Bacteroidia bacterium]|nr:T9SS type A sorting domain-containing protein [Bacteroidia bacterium]
MKRNILFIPIFFSLLVGHLYMKGQTPALWGLSAAGVNGYGSLFSINTGSTAFNSQYNFIGYPGSGPQYVKLVQASNGKLYGTTNIGGSANLGVLFEYDPSTGNYSKLVDFLGTSNGANPQTSLLLASNGKLYGTTRLGGANNLGSIFEYNIGTSTFTKLFDMVSGTGSQPHAALVEASNGKLYGVNRLGGLNSLGTLFEYNISTNTYTALYHFSSATGANPYAALIQASNGKLYGSANAGGTTNEGALYEFDISTSTYSMLVSCTATLTGSAPYSSLYQASNGKLYGTMSGGGSNSGGVIYELDPTTYTYAVVYNMVPATGQFPTGSLIQASNGKLYGMNRTGGANALGSLYEFNPSGYTYTKLVDFSTANGSLPLGAVIQATNGLLYGVTTQAGNSNVGTLFEYNISTSSYLKKIDFNNAPNGGAPLGSLLQAANDKLYGTTSLGGSANLGTIFQYDMSTSTYSKVVDMSAAGGSLPNGSLIQAPNGKLYGLARTGGASGAGAIFEFDYSTNTYTKKIDMTNLGGNSPYGALCLASNGKMYGLANAGGSSNLGSLFEYDYSLNTYTKRVDLTAANGSNPFGSLIQASNGKLYGMTRNGGANAMGVLFEYNPATNTYTKLVDMSSGGGSQSQSTLIQASNGKLYGLTQTGGANGVGALFEYDLVTSTYTKLYDFSAANGQSPFGALRQASNGKLYGLTQSGGANNLGVIFEFDISSSTYTKKMDLSTSSGTSPQFTQLIEVCRVPSTPGAISSSFNSLCQSTPGAQVFSVGAVANSTAYAWSFPSGASVVSGGTTNVVNVDFAGVSPGTFTVGVLAQNICGSSPSSVKSITILPAPVISVNSGSICSGLAFTMNPSGASTYTFSSGSAIVSPTTNSTYSVSGTGTNGCISLSPALSTVSVTALPVIGVNSGAICSGQSFTMNPSGASTYTFSSGSAIVSPTVNSTYSVSGSSADGCVSASPAVANVTVNALPSISVNSGTICSGSSFTMIPGGALTYTFSSGSAVVSPTVTSSYSVTGTDNNGCVSSSPAVSNVTVYALPVISVNSGAICSGKSFTMIPGGAFTYTFSGGSSVVSPLSNTSYSVSGTSTNGCVSAFPAVSNVTVNALPIISVNSGPICFGSSFTMNPGGALTYTFSSGSAVVSPTTTSTYSVTGTDGNGCVSASPAISTVVVNSLPLISVNSGSICESFSFTMNPSGAVSYTFSSGTAIVSPTLTTTYSVTGTDGNGCVSASPAISTVTVHPRPLISVNSGTICLNGSFTMTPSGAATYTFSSGTPVVSPTVNTFYTIVGTSSLGCPATNTAVSNVTVYALPVISVNSGTICFGKTFTMVPSGAVSYTYSSGTPFVSPTVTSSYSVSGTSSLGCVSASPAVANVTVIALPVVSVNSGTICDTQSFTMIPSGAATYTFSSGSAVVSPSLTSSYSVTGTSSVGCVSSNTAVSTVTVYPRPFISVNSGSICATKNFTMNPSGASSYTFSSGSNVVSPLTSTFYTVIGTSSMGCISSNTAVSNVTVAPSPIITVNSGSICSGKVFTMTPGGAVTYTFFNGSSTVSPVVSTSYSVTGTSSLGCVSPTPAISNVTVVPLPNVLINGTNNVCYNSTTTLTASGALTYSWSTGATGSVVAVTPTASNTYSVVGVANTGCSNVTAQAINVIPLPVISAASGAVCPGNSYVISPSGALTYTYSSGSATVTPVSTSTYAIMGTDASGCISASPAVITVSVVNTLTVTVNGNTTICFGENTNLIANGASNYIWSNGVTTNTIVLSPTVTTSYTVVGSSGTCSDTSSVTINVNALPNLSVTASSSVICVNESVQLIASGASTYSWSSNQQVGTIVVSPTITTTYTVYGIDANNCKNTAVYTQSVSECIGITNNGSVETDLKVYPNPNAGRFYVELDKEARLQITDLLGRVILETSLGAGTHEIDLRDSAKGLYVLSITRAQKSQSIRLISQ